MDYDEDVSLGTSITIKTLSLCNSFQSQVLNSLTKLSGVVGFIQ